MKSAFEPIAEVAVASNGTVYEHGWQSWSPTTSYPVTATSARPANAQGRQELGYRPGKPAPKTGFQGEGLLAVIPEKEAPVSIWWAPNPTHEVASIRAQLNGNRLLISADGEVEEVAFNCSLDGALSQWADQLAKQMQVRKVDSLAPGWCSWYQYFQRVSESDVIENLSAIDRFGLEIGTVQLDDGYEAEVGDWLERSPRFPHPLSEIAARISATGRRAGIWIAPMVVGARSDLASRYPGWLVAGANAGYGWDQDLSVLDITHPDALEYIDTVFRAFREWGFSYFKVDFMYAGAIDGRRHVDCTSIGAYLKAIDVIRQSIGEDSILLGCGAPILPSIGRFDAMRVSPDVGINYEPPSRDLSTPSQRSATITGIGRAFQHGRFWVNDPDCLITRGEVERREEWATYIKRFPGLRTSSDRLVSLDPWGLDTTRQLLQPSSPEPYNFGEPRIGNLTPRLPR